MPDRNPNPTNLKRPKSRKKIKYIYGKRKDKNQGYR